MIEKRFYFKFTDYYYNVHCWVGTFRRLHSMNCYDRDVPFVVFIEDEPLI